MDVDVELITAEGVRDFLQTCDNITMINLDAASQLSDELLEKLHDEAPDKQRRDFVQIAYLLKKQGSENDADDAVQISTPGHSKDGAL